MGFKEKMMDRMMGKMSKEEKQNMMDKMMENFFADMTAEDKQKMMATMMPKMMEGDNMMEMMPMMMMSGMGGGKGGGGKKGMMSKMMGEGEKKEKPAMPQMMEEMMPMCIKMMVPNMPKEKRIEFVVTMINTLMEQGCVGLSSKEIKDLKAKVKGAIQTQDGIEMDYAPVVYFNNIFSNR